MASQSKYKNQQVEALSNDLIAVLEKHKAPVDLSLMTLGNLVSNILNNSVQTEAQRLALSVAFAQALQHSLKK